jgi:hypothetical protein
VTENSGIVFKVKLHGRRNSKRFKDKTTVIINQEMELNVTYSHINFTESVPRILLAAGGGRRERLTDS